ncbi:GIY-YIG nuclease family protein [Flavobacterium sp. WW92]|uniref:exonuclease domain-containing protein n=1 Tax=unclassified Flavobacterium TaxID=196869 RepID=UPI0022253735|nr:MULTISPECIES: exonuclease domain-containing protein [unclassified Flavobacterium]WDO12350.1 GIY-YIG nuclease family protein [Flavobacterium sp. WW92]
MKMTEYAIVDIETTGGNASGSRITEICIIIHDGMQVLERWETLVNPQKEIPLPIFALTGISNEMVRDAPVFDDIAEKVLEMLSGRVFVAHNVNFDHSFVRHELELAGLKWITRKLCTVRAARKISPGLPSYSLGNLCRSLEIPLERAHRAGGDADATAILFSRLLEWDTEGEIAQMIRRNSHDQNLPPNLAPSDFEQLPERPGVYYFHDRTGKVVYVGKAKNIKKRVAQHFGGHKITPQRQHFMRDIHSISHEPCATEFMALLLECCEIKKLWPAHNRALKRFEPRFGLYHYQARSGYQYLAVGKLAKGQACVELFHTQYDGVNLLLSLAAEFGIDHRFCHYGTHDEGDLLIRKGNDSLPDLDEHNLRIDRALEHLSLSRPSFGIVDKGRSADERSCVWVEKGHFYGMGYLPSDTGIREASEIRDYVTPYASNGYLMQLINAYAEKYPGKVVRPTVDGN